MILVGEATGVVAGHVVTELCKRGAAVRALVGSPEEADALRGYDCEVAVSGSAQAWQDVDTVFVCLADPGAGALLAAAAPHVRTVLAARAGAELPAREGATVLRHPALMQDLLGSLAALQSGELPWTGDAAVPLVDARDVAAVAAHLLTGDGPQGKAYDVTGPEPLTGADVADRLGALLGRELALRPGPAYEPYPSGPTDEVERGTGSPGRTLERFVSEHRAAFR